MTDFWATLRMHLRVIQQLHIIRVLTGALVLLVLLYSAAFYTFMRLLENRYVSAWESVFWTINRLTTTGELPPELQYTAVPIQALSVLTQVSGLAFVFAVFPLVVIPALERRIIGTPAPVGPMRDHIIIFGFSAVVESLVHELVADAHPFVVVDSDLDLVRRLQQKGIAAIHADPTDDEAMELAGASQAKYIIANREDEEDNAKIILAAGSVSPAKVYALVDDLNRAHYFRYAGAEQVLAPKRLLGTYLAKKAAASWQDELYGASELASDYYLIELPVYPGSPFDGLELREAKIPEKSGATLIGIWHKGKLEVEPGPMSRMSVENVLVAVGTHEQLLQLQKLTLTAESSDSTAGRHYVIAGFGDVGRAVKEVLDRRGIGTKIIDPRTTDGEHIRGDATDETTLIEAGINEASTFIIASHLDRDNIFSTLVARKLNPNLHILARANSRATTDNLYQAGADFVFSLSTIAGQMLAEMLIGDGTITLAEGLKIMTVPVGPRLAGRSIGRARARTRTGCTVVACIQPDGGLCANPKSDYVLKAGTSMIVMGTTAQIRAFRRRFQ